MSLRPIVSSRYFLKDGPDEIAAAELEGHRLLPIGKNSKGRAIQRTCLCCKMKTAHYCSSPKCTYPGKKYFFVCQMSKRRCYQRHLEEALRVDDMDEIEMKTPSNSKRQRRSSLSSWDF